MKVRNLHFSYGWLIAVSMPFFIASLILFRSSSSNQFKAVLGLVVLYLGGAILHHFQDQSLTLELIIEYVLIAGLVLLILQGLII